jgi:hypothetical protein
MKNANGWRTGSKAHKCNTFPTVWAAIYGCKGERVVTWRYTIGNFGRRVPEYACETCQAALARSEACGNDRAAYAAELERAQAAAGIEDYRTARFGLVDGVPTLLGGSEPEATEQAPAFVLVTGNTFPVKDKLKALGGRWDAVAKGWRVPAAQADEAQRLAG